MTSDLSTSQKHGKAQIRSAICIYDDTKFPEKQLTSTQEPSQLPPPGTQHLGLYLLTIPEFTLMDKKGRRADI